MDKNFGLQRVACRHGNITKRIAAKRYFADAQYDKKRISAIGYEERIKQEIKTMKAKRAFALQATD